MAFEYQGVLDAAKAWMVTYLPQWYTNDNIYTDMPKLEDVQTFPMSVIQPIDATPTVPAALVMEYVLGIGFATRAKTEKEAGQQLRAILKDFDNAWSDLNGKPFDTSYGNWTMRSQVGRKTNFSPAFDDTLGLVVYSAAKMISVKERIALVDF